MSSSNATRTFEKDPNYMMLYYAVKTMTGKPDFELIKAKTGIVSTAAV